MEIEWLLWIQEHLSHPVLDVIMKVITNLGSFAFIWVVIMLLIWRKDKNNALTLFFALALSLLFSNFIIKNIFRRKRPFTVYPHVSLKIPAPRDYSFPSGHTSASFAAAFVIGNRYPKYRIPVYVLALLIAFSRLYFFVHYPSDVAVGALIGCVCGYTACLFKPKEA